MLKAYLVLPEAVLAACHQGKRVNISESQTSWGL